MKSVHVFRLQTHTVVFLLLAVTLCILFAEAVQTEMQAAVSRCLTVIIPSLYAMMILSQLLLTTGTWKILAKPFRLFSEKILRLPKEYFALFLVSQFAGYPVGASMLCTLVRQKTLRREDAARLLCVCYGGGPAFLLGLLGDVPNRGKIVGLIFVGNLLTNLLLCQMLFYRHPIAKPPTTASEISPLSAQMLIQCTGDAGRALLGICGIILCFSAMTGICSALGLFRLCNHLTQSNDISVPIAALLQSVLEISNAVTLPASSLWHIPILAGLSAFGGICVLLQIRTVVGDTVPMRKFLLCRVSAALLSGGLCALGLREMPISVSETAVAVSAAPHATANPILPSIMLLCMMLLVFREDAKRN